MSAQTRFRTLVQHIGRIYSAKDEGGSRTELLQSGLNEIMTVIGPKDAKGWATVTADSERLLHIWVAKEADTTAAAVSTQLVNLLKELASSEDEQKESEHPALTITDARPDVIQHNAGGFVEPNLSFPVSTRYVAPSLYDASFINSFATRPYPTIPAFTPVSKTTESKEEFKEIELNVTEEVEEVEEEVVEEEEEVVEEAVEEEVIEPEEEEVEEEVEEEEEGMEVEKYFHRGRSYWRDTNTDKLYAVIDGDEVGDEVGALVGGKAQFLAA